MTMRGFQHAVARLYTAALVGLVIMMFIVVGMNVFSRYVLNSSLGWADELARFLFIYVSLLGAVLAYHDNEHVALDLVIVRIKSRALQMGVRLFGQALIVAALGVFTWYSWEVAVSARNVSPALYIPMSVVYGVMPVTGFLMFVMAILKMRPILEGKGMDDAHTVEVEALQAAKGLQHDASLLSEHLGERK